MSVTEIMEQALSLKASERYELIEVLHRSLDRPDPGVDKVWQEEVLHHIKAIDEGRLELVSMEEVFKDLQ